MPKAAVKKRQKRTSGKRRKERRQKIEKQSLSVKYQAVESFDQNAVVRNRLSAMAAHVSEYAGIPMPLEGEKLVIEPGYKFAGVCGGTDEESDEKKDVDFKVRNRFYSKRHRVDVFVFEEKDGAVTHAFLPAFNHIDYDMHTIGCSSAWGIQQEHNALTLLGTLLNHARFKQYLLTGMFLETSKRSGVTYLFRKLKPTVAIRSDNKANSVRILCALCAHPIAHYESTWAGAMTPTDDVIAHLMLMRGDEHTFWKVSNQHAPHRPEAGL